MKTSTATPAAEALWMAECEIGSSSRGRGLGPTPEKALENLISAWQEACAEWDRGDPLYLHEIQEEVSIVPLPPSGGFVLGWTDARWHDTALRGDDPRFSDVWEGSRGPSPAP